MKKQNVRTLALIVCTLTYLLIGAAVFDALESENEVRTLHLLTNMSRMLRYKYNITDEDYQLVETVVTKSAPFRAGNQWKFSGAFYYAITVLTTIGYGHSTPRTVSGKVFTMCYALAGIPLGLIMFQSIGDRVNRASSLLIRRVKRLLKRPSQEASEMDLIGAVFTLSVLVITGGAAAFSREEGWTYFDSVYYCFITLTTIGFGDMVALQQDNALNTRPDYVAFALVFILFGLAVVAASLNLLVLRFVTMNTEDERRDEAEALQAAQETVRLEGDVITANGSRLVQCDQRGSVSDVTSVCSCPCTDCCPTRPFKRNRSPRSSRRRSSRHTRLLSRTGALETPSPTVEEIISSFRPTGEQGKRGSV